MDNPGHDVLMATMLSGVALLDGAVLLVSASCDSKMPFSQEHVAVLAFLPNSSVLILQNKIDLATPISAYLNY